MGALYRRVKEAFDEAFFAPWRDSGGDPWGEWLPIIDRFTQALAELLQGKKEHFCPQTNLSSALSKFVMSYPELQKNNIVVLMSESDFPSIGFAMKMALPKNAIIRFIPKELDVTDILVWDEYLKDEVTLVMVSHAYSNTGYYRH